MEAEEETELLQPPTSLTPAQTEERETGLMTETTAKSGFTSISLTQADFIVNSG